MSKFYFFTDPSLLNNQSSGEEYGPATPSGGKDRFRITSVHTANSAVNAVAVCTGTICVQEVDTNLVSIILKPSYQPNFRCVPIKYFIYKGVKKSSLINNSTSEVANSTNNDLTSSIWENKTVWNSATGETDNPSQNSLGIQYSSSSPTPYTFTDSEIIDNLFYQADDNYQLPTIQAGWEIGEFDNTKFGFEIVLESNYHLAKVELSRTLENYIQVTSISGSSTQAESFQHWNGKEKILSFIDPAAFFGMFYNHELNVNSGGNHTVYSKGDLFTNVLNPLKNKSLIYLDLRNEHGLSFNFYQNYTVSSNNLQIGYGIGSTLTELDYYDSANDGWPILRIESSSFPSGNQTNHNVIRISLPKGDNYAPLLFIDQGIEANIYPEESNGSKRFIVLNSQSGNYNDPVDFAVPNISGSTIPVSTLLSLSYLYVFDENQSISPNSIQLRNACYLDNLFPAFSFRPASAGNEALKVLVSNNAIFLNGMKSSDGLKYMMIKPGIAETSTSLVFFAVPSIIWGNSVTQNTSVNLPSKRTDSYSEFLPFLESYANNYMAKRSQFKFTSGDLDYLDIVQFNAESTESESENAELENFIAISIDKSNLDTASLGNLLTDCPILIGISNIQLGSDEINQPLVSLDLVLNGYKLNGSTVETESTNINITLRQNGSIF